MRTIKIPSFKSFDLSIKQSLFPNEWILSLIGRYDYMIFSPRSPRSPERKATGFYLLKTDDAVIIFENEDSTWRQEIEATIKKVWHPGNDYHIKLQSIVNPFTLQEIHKHTYGKDLKISWRVSGNGFSDEKEHDIPQSFIFILASSSTSKKYSRIKFLTDILEKVDRFKREIIEITIPTKEAIVSISEDLEPLATLLKRSDILKDALKKMYDATYSIDYAGSIGTIRSVLGTMADQLNKIKGIIAESLFLNLGAFTGDGAATQSTAMVSHLLNIMRGIENLASGMGIHLETKEREPKNYTPHPDFNDNRYILLTSILTLDYLSKKLQNYNIRQAI